MGSSASKTTKTTNKPEPEVDSRRKILMQRKVTVDILEKLARRLPKVSNPLGTTLRLKNCYATITIELTKYFIFR